MVCVFSVFGVLSFMIFKQIGVGLAAAILIDATIVRAVLLPATMKLLGDWNWYLPSWLEWLPHLEHGGSAEPSRLRPPSRRLPRTSIRAAAAYGGRTTERGRLMEIAPAHHSVRRPAGARLLAAVRTESGLFLLGIGVVALHVLDDNFLQPHPGTSASDHLVSGLVPLALLLAAAVALRPRSAPASAATIALLLGFFGVLAGTEAVYYTRAVGPSGDDFTGLLSILGGLLLLGVGIVTLWRSRRTGRSAAGGGTAGVSVSPSRTCVPSQVAVLIPFAIGYVVTHVARAEVPRPELGAAYEDVEFTTSDGLKLKGWYIPSKNGAAVIAFPGRSGTQNAGADAGPPRLRRPALRPSRRRRERGRPERVRLAGRARHPRCRCVSLQRRSDVDPERIGGIGLSVGGEMMIEAAAESAALKAIVSEGASGRSVRDILANPGGRGRKCPKQHGHGRDRAVHEQPAAGRPEGPRAEDRSAPRCSSSTASRVRAVERSPPTARSTRPRASRSRSGRSRTAGHIAGITTEPEEYERRVIGFFDKYLRVKS